MSHLEAWLSDCMQKEKTQLAMLHVRGAAVRFVHVPGRLDPNSAIVAHRKRVAEAAKAARRQHDAGQPPYHRSGCNHAAPGDCKLHITNSSCSASSKSLNACRTASSPPLLTAILCNHGAWGISGPALACGCNSLSRSTDVYPAFLASCSYGGCGVNGSNGQGRQQRE
jgi:hypothetical protein